MLGDWMIVSTGRQERTFLPPDAYCPLCPTASADSFATEIPTPDFEIAVFENRWPSFRRDAPEAADGGWAERRARAVGVCEVVVYTADHAGTLASMTQRQSRQLVDVWADRYEELAARPEVEYVFIFENRGKEIGVTLTHPHGQIYAFPFVPPRVGQEHEAAARHGSIEACLICDIGGVGAQTARARRRRERRLRRLRAVRRAHAVRGARRRDGASRVAARPLARRARRPRRHPARGAGALRRPLALPDALHHVDAPARDRRRGAPGRAPAH